MTPWTDGGGKVLRGWLGGVSVRRFEVHWQP
jgi:hypothetical protein